MKQILVKKRMTTLVKVKLKKSDGETTFYLTVSGIMKPSLKSIEQF